MKFPLFAFGLPDNSRAGLLLAVLAAGCSVVQSVAACQAVDPFPVSDGLVLRLDASRAETLRTGEAEPGKDMSVQAWSTESDSKPVLSFVQPDEKQRPVRITIGEASVLRFDGLDDHLRCSGTGVSAEALTLFVVAAPHSNPGDFRGLLAANAPDRRDYESGLTLDLGPGATAQLDQMNLEGRGFGGAKDLLNSTSDFGTLHTFECIIDPATQKTALWIDGKPEGDRPFVAGNISLEELTVGARYYTNGPGAQQVRGSFHGDIAEILIFSRVLSDAETADIRGYFTRKYETLAKELPGRLKLPGRGGVQLAKVTNPPLIQMMLPGFSVSELPVELTNVNNVRYRHDGKLLTLGYNGDIHLLTDTDGDGVEDHAEIFWKNTGSVRGPLGMLPTPKDYPRGSGVFVPSKGKVSLFADTDGDDKADQEIIVAQGWKEIPQNVDAVGITMDAKGSLYFGLGTVNYANAYLVNDQGKGEYDLKSDRGTVQKVSPDFSSRQAVCTGVRFPIAFAFNEHGDLFCTEQEGATWLPNGNPLDELLHIRLDGQGPNGTNSLRHYGFPPRHPQHNPTVIDEPSTFDFGPQHQSTCGMVFNESVNGGPVFGPSDWKGDALVCGESRGKLWRTRLTRTDSGYVAASQLLACLRMLTTDCCVAPDGSLIVSCHSGPPDWGTGPAGTGRLFRIRMVQKEAARPVQAWAENPQEIRIAFDQPVDPARLRNLTERIEIHYGLHVRAGDQYETLVPPYAVVKAQQMQPRFRLNVTGTSLTNDLRTLIISTDPMSFPGTYAVRIPLTASPDASAGLAQAEELNIDFSLCGVLARWTPAAGATAMEWSGCLPHPDLTVCRKLLQASAGHAPLWQALEQPGILTLRTRANLHDFLRPAVQPGSSIDYQWPPEHVSVSYTSNRELVVEAREVQEGDRAPVELSVLCHATGVELRRATLTAPVNAPHLVEMTVSLQTGKSSVPQLTVAANTNEDADLRPIPLHRFLLPWVLTEDSSDDKAPAKVIPELAGGSWARGRKVFRGEVAGCSKCHAIGGDGAVIGPDLTNLVHREYSSVVRDITNPSFSINPDYVGHVIALHDGRTLTGILQTVSGQLMLGDDKGRLSKLDSAEIESMVTSTVSVMPTGIPQKLSAEQLKDLLTYLMTKPPQMPLDSPLTAPPLRTRAEVDAALAGAPEQTVPVRSLNIVLVDGPKDHGPGEHDYPAWKSAWEVLLSAADEVSVSTAAEFPNDEQLATADVVIFFQKGSFDQHRPEKLDAFLARGGGAVYIHWAVNGNDQVQPFSERIGYASWGGRIAFRHGPLTLDIHHPEHPIVRNFDRLQLYDESYWKLTGRPDGITLLATSTEDGSATPQIWATERGNGRVFVSIPGHYSWTFDDPLFRILLLRGIAWTAREPVDRFNDLVTLGARVSGTPARQ